MTDRKWYDDTDNCVALAYWLEEHGSFRTTADCIYFFEKPWKWDREHDLWLLWKAAEGDPKKCERVVEAVIEETSAEDLMAEWEEVS